MNILSVKDTKMKKFIRRVIKYSSWWRKKEIVLFNKCSEYGGETREWYFENGSRLNEDIDKSIEFSNRFLKKHSAKDAIEQDVTEHILGEG